MKFKDLKINDRFNFVRDPQWLCLAHGPWIKLSARKYMHIEDVGAEIPDIHRVGTINAEIENL